MRCLNVGIECFKKIKTFNTYYIITRLHHSNTQLALPRSTALMQMPHAN